MTYRIKPLVWRSIDDGNLYQSTHGGFTVKLEDSGWVWRRGHIFGMAPSRQDALDYANKRHFYEVGFLLEPTDPLADAMNLPEIKALVAAANCLNDEVIMTMGDKRSSLAQPSRGMTTALAALTK